MNQCIEPLLPLGQSPPSYELGPMKADDAVDDLIESYQAEHPYHDRD